MQPMSDGFITDPHEGNLLGLPTAASRCSTGLMAQMRDHQEAMASGVLNIMAENYGALEEVFKGMGVLNTQVDDLRRDGVDEPFSDAIRRCMTGGAADARARNLIQDDDGGDRRRAFGQLYEELGELAFSYYFTIPSYYILVMRAFVTLEGIALANDGDEFNMYEATAPYARRTLLTPRTAGGRALLRAAFLSSGAAAPPPRPRRGRGGGVVAMVAESGVIITLYMRSHVHDDAARLSHAYRQQAGSCGGSLSHSRVRTRSAPSDAAAQLIAAADHGEHPATATATGGVGRTNGGRRRRRWRRRRRQPCRRLRRRRRRVRRGRRRELDVHARAAACSQSQQPAPLPRARRMCRRSARQSPT